MSAMFHVYVAGAIDPSPDALRKLAEIMASRYGLPIADVTARLAKGRFRVKANVDRATADVYLSDLGAVGAKVVIEEASAKPSSPSIPVPSRTATPASGLPAPSRTATPPSGLSAAAGRISSPSIPAPSRTATPPSGLSAATSAPKPASNTPFASGLAAAFENTTSGSQDLGVLGGDSGSFALSSVDGNDAGAVQAPVSFAPPPAAAAPPSAPKISSEAALSAANQTDMFAPPDADDAEQRVDIASDEIAHQKNKVEEAARRRVASSPVNLPGTATSPVLQRKASSSIAPLNTPVTTLAPRGRLGLLSEPRNRMAAGVLVAILLGFLPTHLIASWREHDAYNKVDGKFLTDAASAPDPGTWASLDEPAMKDKKSAQHSIFLTSFLLWALFSAGAGYVWFKRVPWDKLDAVT